MVGTQVTPTLGVTDTVGYCGRYDTEDVEGDKSVKNTTVGGVTDFALRQR